VIGNPIRLVGSAMVVLLFLAACGDTKGTNNASEELSPTSTLVATPTTVTTGSVGPTTVTFNGSSCQVEGRLSLSTGLNEFHIINTSGETGNVILAHIEDGFTVDDVRNDLEQSDSQPWWVDDVILSHFPSGGDIGSDKTVSYNLSTGTWVLVCATNLPAENWVATEVVLVG